MKKRRLLRLLALLVVLLCLGATPLAAEEAAEAETSAAAKLVAITFDDGPGPYTAKLLDALKVRNAHATFFVVGNRVNSYASLVTREAAEGHQIGNHSWSHAKLTSLGGGALANELNNTSAAIANVVGGGGFYLRPPYGSLNSTVRSYAGVPIILWSVDTLDWKYRNAATVKNNILNGAKDGAIILLHDIHGTSVDGAIAAIDTLQSQGYEFVTVSELMRRRGVTPVAGQAYSALPYQGVDIPAVDDGADYDEAKLSEHWAYASIQFVKERGIFYGTSPTAFSPDKYMTRAMFVTVLARMSGEALTGYNEAFEDVAEGSWYQQAVAWGASKGLVKGTAATTFAPEAFVTREEMCVFLDRYAAYTGVTLKDSDASQFKDAAAISDYARASVEKLQRSALIRGVGNDLFEPRGKATRAQVATICRSYLTAYVDGK